MPCFSLKGEEKQMLFWKYKQSGLTNYEANEKLDNMIRYLRKFVLKLMDKKKSDEEIENDFKKEFGIICMKAEI